MSTASLLLLLRLMIHLGGDGHVGGYGGHKAQETSGVREEVGRGRGRRGGGQGRGALGEGRGEGGGWPWAFECVSTVNPSPRRLWDKRP